MASPNWDLKVGDMVKVRRDTDPTAMIHIGEPVITAVNQFSFHGRIGSVVAVLDGQLQRFVVSFSNEKQAEFLGYMLEKLANISPE